MLHSQAIDPIKGNLVAHESTQDISNCQTPIIQVKILRRPNQTNSHQQKRQDIVDASTRVQLASASVQNHRADKEPQASAIIYDNDDEWPSIADASRYSGSQKIVGWNQRHKINVMKKPAASSLIGGEDTTERLSSQSDTNKRPTGPLKSYQERVDDYAKARLRILGSAFPDDERPDDKTSR